MLFIFLVLEIPVILCVEKKKKTKKLNFLTFSYNKRILKGSNYNFLFYLELKPFQATSKEVCFLNAFSKLKFFMKFVLIIVFFPFVHICSVLF